MQDVKTDFATRAAIAVRAVGFEQLGVADRRAPSAEAAATSSAGYARAEWNSDSGLWKQKHMEWMAAGVTTQHRCRC